VSHLTSSRARSVSGISRILSDLNSHRQKIFVPEIRDGSGKQEKRHEAFGIGKVGQRSTCI